MIWSGTKMRIEHRHGFTLAELLVTITIMGIILSALCAVLMQSIAAHQQTVAEASLQDRAVRAEKQLSYDLAGAYRIWDAEETELILEDQSSAPGSPHFIRYYLEGGVLKRTADGSTSDVADGIISLRFAYYEWEYYDIDGDGDKDDESREIPAGSPADQLQDVHRVAYTITFKVDDYQYTIHKQVKLRNNP